MGGGDEMPSPSERLFRYDVAHGARFLAGVAAGHWRLVSIDWPYAVIVLSAARDGVQREVTLRFNLDGYRRQPPTAMPWDIERGAMLEPARWPQGGAALNRAFNPNWRVDGQPQALYIPCDRVALPGHEGWITTRPEYAWGPGCDITTYLKHARRLLDDDAFLASAQAA
ncbi:MAG TPA: hypothetical protein VGH63_20350 [Polyangia bacterium]|jgi:hypothetical protein